MSNIDKTAPTAPSIIANSTTPTSGDVTITITYSGDSSIKEYRIDGGSWQSYSSSFTVGSNCKIEARGTDEAGNSSSLANYEVNNINELPSLNSTVVNNQIVSGVMGFRELIIQGTLNDRDVGDILKVYFRVDGNTGDPGTQVGSDIISDGTDQTISQPVDLGDIVEGKHVIHIWAEDDKGGKTDEIPYNFEVDKTALQITTINILDEDITTNSIKFTTTVENIMSNDVMSDLHSMPYAYKISGQTDYMEWISLNSYDFINLEPNTQYTIFTKARDLVGNEVESSVQRYTKALPPGNISYSNITNTELTINWEHNGNPEANTKYEISRKLEDEKDSAYTVIGTDVIGTSFNDSSITVDNMYVYKVLAINGDGLKTDFTTGQPIGPNYFLDNLEHIAGTRTDEELKQAILNILGSDSNLYYPTDIRGDIVESKYLELLRQELIKRRAELGRQLTGEEVKQVVALVNINIKLYIRKENIIIEEELRLALLDNMNRYNSTYLLDYQNELKRMYDADIGGIMKLTFDEVLQAIKLVNFNKKPINSITAEDIKDLIGDAAPVHGEYIENYRNIIEALGSNPTLEKIIEAVKFINITMKIEDGSITIKDLIELLPDTKITHLYFDEYKKYLFMYQNDLKKKLTKEEIKQVIETVNDVLIYKEVSSDENKNKANSSINELKNGDTKDELQLRITPLEKPTVKKLHNDIYNDEDLSSISSLEKLSPSSRKSFESFLDGNIDSITVKFKGKKTILVRDGNSKIEIANLQGVKEYRYIKKTGLSNEYQDWQKIENEKIEENLSFNQQGFYSGGIQLRNKAGITSSITNIDFIIDNKKPTGKIEKFVPMQNATKENYIKIKLEVNDNLNVPMYAKINNRWDVMPTGYFNYKLNEETGLKVIEIQISDLCGNKATLKDTVWKMK